MLERIPRENIPPIAPSLKGLGAFHFKKGTPKRITTEILSRYGRWIQAGEGAGAKMSAPVEPDAAIDFTRTDFYKKAEARLTPGKSLKHLREANGLSQSELGSLIGSAKPVRASRISDWESDFRAISKPVAKKLAAIFHVSSDRFI